MPRPTPTLVAVFVSGALLGSLTSQALSILGKALEPTRRETPWDATQYSPPATNAAPLDVGGSAFLAELRAKQGSVLEGTSLESTADTPASFVDRLTQEIDLSQSPEESQVRR